MHGFNVPPLQEQRSCRRSGDGLGEAMPGAARHSRSCCQSCIRRYAYRSSALYEIQKSKDGLGQNIAKERGAPIHLGKKFPMEPPLFQAIPAFHTGMAL